MGGAPQPPPPPGDLTAAKRRTREGPARPPARPPKATKPVGGWMRRGEREEKSAGDRPAVVTLEGEAGHSTKAPARKMAWCVRQRRPGAHPRVVSFCVSYNNRGGGVECGGGETRPQTRGADWLVRMWLCAGGTERPRRPLLGNRTPPASPAPAEPTDSRSRRSQAGLGKREQRSPGWGGDCVGPGRPSR